MYHFVVKPPHFARVLLALKERTTSVAMGALPIYGGIHEDKNQGDINFVGSCFYHKEVPSPFLSKIAVISMLIRINTIKTMERPLPKCQLLA